MTPHMRALAGMPFAWLGNRTWEAQCLDTGFSIAYTLTLERSELSVWGYSLEACLGSRPLWGSNELFNSRLLELVDRQDPFLTGCHWLLSYVPLSQPIPGLPHPLWHISPGLQSLWADKRKTRQWSARAGVPTMPIIERATERKRLFVLQKAKGSCGAGTYIGMGEAIARKLDALRGVPTLLSPFKSGPIINGHIAVFGNNRIEIPWPSIQLVQYAHEGDIALPLYAGNDYLAYSRLRPEIRQQAQDIFFRLGQLAAREGYVGLLGADLLFSMNDDSLTLLEINARMQGSTGLLSLLQSAAGIKPTSARMFMAMLGIDTPPVELDVDLPLRPDTPYAQFCIRKNIYNPIFLDSNKLFTYGAADPATVTRYGVIERRVFNSEIACYFKLLD